MLSSARRAVRRAPASTGARDETATRDGLVTNRRRANDGGKTGANGQRGTPELPFAGTGQGLAGPSPGGSSR
jgi:hypothetical protein